MKPKTRKANKSLEIEDEAEKGWWLVAVPYSLKEPPLTKCQKYLDYRSFNLTTWNHPLDEVCFALPTDLP